MTTINKEEGARKAADGVDNDPPKAEDEINGLQTMNDPVNATNAVGSRGKYSGKGSVAASEPSTARSTEWEISTENSVGTPPTLP